MKNITLSRILILIFISFVIFLDILNNIMEINEKLL